MGGIHKVDASIGERNAVPQVVVNKPMLFKPPPIFVEIIG
jgi:hypothetical protein